MNLADILQRADVWRGDELPPMPAIPSGFTALDQLLPGGGWPLGALTEIGCAGEGIGELQLVLPALVELSRGDRWIAFIAPPYIPYAPALTAAGVDLSRLLMVYPKTRSDHLWAVEASLRAGACAFVLSWGLNSMDGTQWRRLQLAAEASGTGAILFQRSAPTGSTAALRLHLESAADGGRLNVHVVRRRGGGSIGPLVFEVDHALAMSAPAGSAAGNLHARRAVG